MSEAQCVACGHPRSNHRYGACTECRCPRSDEPATIEQAFQDLRWSFNELRSAVRGAVCNLLQKGKRQ